MWPIRASFCSCGADLWGRHAAGIVVGCPRTDREFAAPCCRFIQAQGASGPIEDAAAVVSEFSESCRPHAQADQPRGHKMRSDADKVPVREYYQN